MGADPSIGAHCSLGSVRAIMSDDLSSCREALERIVTRNISPYVATAHEHGNSPAEMNAALPNDFLRHRTPNAGPSTSAAPRQLRP